MAIVGERWGIFPILRSWVEDGKPIWGTCAGMILLSNYAIKQREGGQALVGGLDAKVCRNYFGPQINSSEFSLPGDFLKKDETDQSNQAKYSAVFIRAPAILEVM